MIYQHTHYQKEPQVRRIPRILPLNTGEFSVRYFQVIKEEDLRALHQMDLTFDGGFMKSRCLFSGNCLRILWQLIIVHGRCARIELAHGGAFLP